MDPKLTTEHQNLNEVVACSEKLQCLNSCTIRIAGNGKSCHQCRQKKEYFAATCKNLKKGKICPIKFCHRCLLTRYGENAEEVGQLDNWTCPKCRDFCNCSLCQKKRGEQPTGPLYRNAKESGFNSVAHMLAKNKATSEALVLNKVNDMAVMPSDEATMIKEPEVLPSRELEKGNCSHTNDVTKVCKKDDGGDDDVGVMFKGEITRFSNVGMSLQREKIVEEILLPPGIQLTKVLDIELPPKDVGNALQFLEFCRVFEKVLDLKEGEAETILHELVHQESFDEEKNTLPIQFHIRLLALILNDLGNESQTLLIRNENNLWLKHLENLIAESYHILNDFPLNWFQECIKGYYRLDLSNKFKLLNFLCDEALTTEKLRSYIRDENAKHSKEEKETKIKVATAKKKEKGLKHKLQNEKTKAFASNLSPFEMEEHNTVLRNIKSEIAEVHEVHALKDTIPKGKYNSDVMRIQPEFLDNNGQGFWRLESLNGEYAFLLQDIKLKDKTATAPDEKWFIYDSEKKDEVNNYIFSRAKKLKSY